ncbi:Rpn family recombination-promoting nuclease/putative transposase [Segatella copri]|uniref:Rpn family recombination-promoting nuclease/putative transposase n=1 Tax=Segatella copri TaxID=165179 RepID=UPI0020CDB460|nr:Rpn family recombination-promoting nuclease/putative transposase [Segatella copri]MCP9592440.1 Rpn family recombination-promoting nuclease/putative transposase [Segatella copri]
MNKDLLICFLNSLFNGRQVVKDVSYLNPDHVGDVYTDRRAIFDVYIVNRWRNTCADGAAGDGRKTWS